jgi:ABC-type phosphate/phosphonate transport system substrate-binding protein
MAKTMNARLLAVAVPGTHAPQMRGAVIVRSGSPIRQLSDLRGKIVATISRRATAGCLAPLKLCREQGLEADRDFRLVTMADEDRILWAVVRGRIDAGFVHEQSLNTMPAGMLREQLRVVAYTQEVPTWCVAAFPRTDPEVAARVTAALLQLDGNNPEHQAILDPMRLSGFTAGNDADYAPARKLADELGVPY